MQVFEIVLGVILLILGVAISVLVMFQTGKDKRLSGTIAGGSDTFFGKGKSNSRDKKMSTWTAILSVAFAVLVIAMYVIAA